MEEFSRYDLVTVLTSIHLARVKESLLVGILFTANNRLIMRVVTEGMYSLTHSVPGN